MHKDKERIEVKEHRLIEYKIKEDDFLEIMGISGEIDFIYYNLWEKKVEIKIKRS